MRKQMITQLFLVAPLVLIIAFVGLANCAQAASNQKVVAIVHLSTYMQEVLPSKSKQYPPNHFQVVRNSLASLIKSEFVLQSALVRPEIARLKTVVKHEPHSVKWLQQALAIELPENSELVVLSIIDPGDIDELKKILNQVISAFQNEVLSADMIRKEEARQNLRKYYQEASKNYRNKLDRYLTLRKELRTSDDEEIQDAELQMLNDSLTVERKFLDELTRELLIRDLNSLMVDERFRILQSATAVSN